MFSLSSFALMFLFVLVVVVAVGYDFWVRFGSRFDSSAILGRLKGKLFLTYDDGPASDLAGWCDSRETALAHREAIVAIDPDWDFDASPTINLLRTLAEFGAQAIFFVRGDILTADASARETVKALQRAGHLIGNHSFSHTRFHQMSSRQALDEMEQTDNLIHRVTGSSPELFRPPYGLWHVRLTVAMFRRPLLRPYALPISWTHTTQDWDLKPSDASLDGISQSVDALLADARESSKGVVLLQHDVWIYSVLYTRVLLRRLRSCVDLKLGLPVDFESTVLDGARAESLMGLFFYYVKARSELVVNLLRKA